MKTCFVTSWLFACTNIPTLVHPAPSEAANPLLLPTSTLLQNDLNIQMAILATPRMNTERAAHTATLFPDGTVLLAGGFANGEQALASAELFDPGTKTFLPTGAMSAARQSHTATLLPGGKVLMAGGFNGNYLKSTELYEPKTGLFSPAAEMNTARSGHVAILLNNGKVLLAGGVGAGWTFLESAEIYDPETGTFSPTGSMLEPRESHTATLLSNGKVLITGGHQGRQTNIVIYDSAELYDPVNGTFSETGKMTVRRHKHDATLLADGRVFISGGADERDSLGAYHSTEIYDPVSDAFSSSGEMVASRYKHTGTSLLLNNGQVLITGGANVVEVFDPLRGTFTIIPSTFEVGRFFATTTMLPDGNVLFAGGYGDNISASSKAWILRLTP